jgi:hypothetical protein
LLGGTSRFIFEKPKILCAGPMPTPREEKKGGANGVEDIFTSLGNTTGDDSKRRFLGGGTLLIGALGMTRTLLIGEGILLIGAAGTLLIGARMLLLLGGTSMLKFKKSKFIFVGRMSTTEEETEGAKGGESMLASLWTTSGYDSKGKLFCESFILEDINQNEVKFIFNT